MKQKLAWLRPLLGLLAALCLAAALFARPQICQYLENWFSRWQQPPEQPEAQAYYLTLQHAQGQAEAEQIALEEAVVGFVAAEMPASYDEAALAAQAVAARSYAWYKQQAEGQVCDDSGHCMAYLDEAGRKERWGSSFTGYESKIRQAAQQTAGLILTQNGQPLPAYFNASCGGQTESPAACFGGQELWAAAPCYWEGERQTVDGCFWPKAELAERLQLNPAELPLLHISASTPSGRVKELRCGSQSWSGQEFRNLLGLKSCRISWAAGQEGFWFTTLGWGHGVGLCQQGAAGLAAQGADWRQILAIYYPGCPVEPLVKISPIASAD